MEGTADIRAFVLGPPRSADLLGSEDPIDKEGFPGHGSNSHNLSFAAAVQSGKNERTAPFSEQFRVPVKDAFFKRTYAGFFTDHYGKKDEGILDADMTEVLPNASWRRIDDEWLYAADSLALKLNRGINNTSLVLAFELPKTKKILLFVGDAQRGNWISWDDYIWQDGDKKIDARDILSRTVLYKVGHHGSHNATLNGKVDDDYPNLSWLGRGKAASEFTAMVTAVNKWALTKNTPPWRHPLPSIKNALLQKAQGRVFQTDEDRLENVQDIDAEDWEEFLSRSNFTKLYFDYTILDE